MPSMSDDRRLEKRSWSTMLLSASWQLAVILGIFTSGDGVAFVFGLRNQKLRQQLLGIEDLPYNKVLDLALASEAAAKKLKEMQSGSTATPQATVQRVQKQKATPTQGQQRTDCYHCGGKHKAAECKFKEAICHFCKKRGNLAHVCRSKQRQKKATTENAQNAHCLTEDQDSTDSADDEFGPTLHCESDS